jgi:hypothetical protein
VLIHLAFIDKFKNTLLGELTNENSSFT